MAAAIFLAFIGPIFGAQLLWGEDFYASMNFNIARYVLGLHVNWSINSFTHMWGTRPYDK
jgi:stearoyl-CoA desaturase (Delta-9 desaturase)